MASAAVDRSPRVALVVDNNDYDPANFSVLENSVNDARLIANALERVGFTVALATDVDRDSLEREIEAVGKRLKRAGEDALGHIYHAGLGVEAEG